MKKLLFAVSALAALSLLAPSTGLAQATNHMSLFADEAGTINAATMDPFSNLDIYLVMMDPYNPDLGQPIDFLGGVEFAIPTAANVIVASFNWPVPVTDVGTGVNHIVGFGTPLQVIDGMATVCAINIIYTAATGDPAFLKLAPATPASNPGFMAILDSADEGNVISVLPPYDNFDYDVFAINGEVATEPATMDGIKALYR